VACYSCQAVMLNFLMVDDDCPICISHLLISTQNWRPCTNNNGIAGNGRVPPRFPKLGREWW
jgi:hypothetical protein